MLKYSLAVPVETFDIHCVKVIPQTFILHFISFTPNLKVAKISHMSGRPEQVYWYVFTIHDTPLGKRINIYHMPCTNHGEIFPHWGKYKWLKPKDYKLQNPLFCSRNNMHQTAGIQFIFHDPEDNMTHFCFSSRSTNNKMSALLLLEGQHIAVQDKELINQKWRHWA